MRWSRPNPANEPDPLDNDNPLADHMHPNRPRRATNGDTEPLSSANTPGNIYDQQTVVDNNFVGRSRLRRERQGASPFQTRQITAWVGDPRNSNRLLIFGGAALVFLLLLGAISVYNRLNRAVPVTDLESPTAAPGIGADMEPGSETSSTPDPGGFEMLPPQPEPEQPPAPPTSAFVVFGTGSEGLFLRPEPNTNNTPLATLPEGTRVEWIGELSNDGIREWRRVRTDFGEGWVAAEYLQPAP